MFLDVDEVKDKKMLITRCLFNKIDKTHTYTRAHTHTRVSKHWPNHNIYVLRHVISTNTISTNSIFFSSDKIFRKLSCGHCLQH